MKKKNHPKPSAKIKTQFGERIRFKCKTDKELKEKLKEFLEMKI